MEDIVIGKTYIPVEKITGGEVKAKTPIILPQWYADKIAHDNEDYLSAMDEIEEALDYCNIAYVAYNKETKRLFELSVISDKTDTFVTTRFTEIDCSTMKIVAHEIGYDKTRYDDIRSCGGWTNFKELLSAYYTKQNWSNKLKKRPAKE